jgi:hypothetical protein
MCEQTYIFDGTNLKPHACPIEALESDGIFVERREKGDGGVIFSVSSADGDEIAVEVPAAVRNGTEQAARADVFIASIRKAIGAAA